MRYTLDREALNQGMYFGLGEVHNQPFKTTSSWYLDVPTVKRDLAKAKAIYKTIVEKGIEEVGTPLYTTNLPVVDAWRDYVQGFDAFGYDLVSINAEMGLHKTWIAK